jgi:hypothetical protein
MLSLFILAAWPAGAINPAVTQDNIASTVCVAGWTATMRPPASYTSRLKRKQMAAQGIKGRPSSFEEDHLISLEIGGHPTDPANLWPQPWKGPQGAHRKDRLENALRREICSGRMTLTDAQNAIRTDWVAAYKRYVK